MLETLVQLSTKDKWLSLDGTIDTMDQRFETILDHWKCDLKDIRYVQTVINTNTGMRVTFDIWFEKYWNISIDILSFTNKISPSKTCFKGVTLEKTHDIVSHYSKLFLKD